jgi:cephalosporin-C deacetylase-like acetyl esterase
MSTLEGRTMPTIREHLCRVAADITDGSLASIDRLEQWQQERPQRYRQYLEMQGLVDGLAPAASRPDLRVTTTGRLEREDVVIEKLHFQSLPRLYVAANLYLPRKLNAPAPAVLYLCGHSPSQKHQYQAHARRWAQLGFVCLIMDTLEYAESPGDHHGAYSSGQFHWYSRGYRPAGVEMWNAIRAIDLLQQRDEVDPERIGVTGISGGGAITWWTAAADDRVKVAAPVCGTGTIRSHVIDRSWDDHCDCMWFNNTYRHDQSDVGALIAPRQLLIASADRDYLFSIASVRECHQRVRRIYDMYGAADDCLLVETPGPHSYHPTSRQRIFAFFLKHLMGVDRPWQEIGDVGELRESEEALRVYINGPPDDERTSTIHEGFIPRAEPPAITGRESFFTERERVVQALTLQTFAHFPQKPCDLRIEVTYEHEDNDGRPHRRIAFDSEPDVRLIAQLSYPLKATEDGPPVLLYLHEPEAGRRDFETMTRPFVGEWARMAFWPRGTGETASGRELDWHLRRAAALTGRTVASMQVYDALRAVQVVRGEKGVNAKRISIMGRGRMAVVALYAALLDGNLETVVLVDPPASQDVDDRCGTPGIEMLSCLRFTDLPQVAGLLWPSELVFVGHRPSTYAWAEQVYRTLGGRVVHALSIANYRPSPAQPASGS